MQTMHTINWASPEPTVLAHSADLRHLFVESVPGGEYAQRMPVEIVPHWIAHVIEKSADGRVKRLKDRPDLIIRAIASPEIVEAKPEYLDSIGHYKLAFIVEDDRTPKMYVGVALSLANLPGQHNCEKHYVLTLWCPDHRNLFTPQGEMKPRYRLVDRMLWPQKHREPT